MSFYIVNKVSRSFAMLAKNLIMQVSNAIRPTCSPGHRLPFEKDQTEASRRALLGILLGTFICLALVSLGVLVPFSLDRRSEPSSTGPPSLSSVVLPTATKFAYRATHSALPLPANLLVQSTPSDHGLKRFDSSAWKVELNKVRPHEFSRSALCSLTAAVARANNLPIPFFANLIWQESSFNIKVVSRAGAQGVAQFMPRTAVDFGLLNPFDPVHALSVSGNFLRILYLRFGNLGLTAAAYNAGPQRVKDWISNRGRLPEETRNYVLRITSRSVEDWLQMNASAEDILMPPGAPCVEVVERLQAQWVTMRVTEREFAGLPDS
jgi:hypothetical protein